jgi:sugar O-acyltransferase (sialic acid O-acetyltransferase NeuD family)
MFARARVEGCDAMSDLVIFGTSNMLGSVLDLALALNHRVTHVVLNQPEDVRSRMKSTAERIAALPHPPRIIDIDAFRPQSGEIYFLGTTAHGRTNLVARLKEQFGLRFASLIHPFAYVSPLAQVGEGVWVSAMAMVQAHVIVGDHAFVGTNVTLGHDSVIEPYACIRGGTTLAGSVVVGRGAEIGIGVSVVHERTIGADALVGAGAVVTRDVEPGMVVVGAPARVTRRRFPGASPA